MNFRIRIQLQPKATLVLFFIVGLIFPAPDLFARLLENRIEKLPQTFFCDSLKERKLAMTIDSDTLRAFSDSSFTMSINQPISLKGDSASRLDPLQIVLWSILIPGFGQFYNESYWKMPLVYGGLGAMMYLALTNNTLYLDYRERYINSLNTNDPLAESNRRLRDFYRTNRDQYYIFFVAVYAIALLDAYIDAHFFGFETSDNLTIRIAPEFGPSQNALNPPMLRGASVGIQFGF